MVGLTLMVIFMSICFHVSDVFACFVAFALCDFSGWCLVDSVVVVVVVVVVALSLCFLYEFFLLSGFALSRSTLHMSFAFYRTTKYRKRYIFRYRRLYHFVAIRDCWSAIIVDTLFGGQLIHSYIQDINTSLTHHFWLSGYPASSFAVRCLRATKVAGGALQSAKWVKRRTSQLFSRIAKTFNKLNNNANKLITAKVGCSQRRSTWRRRSIMAPYPSAARMSWGFRDTTDGECIGTGTQRNRRSDSRL